MDAGSKHAPADSTAPPTGLTAPGAWPRTAAQTLSVGLFGGTALGVVARAWMRVISDDPEFSWNGTLFIVGGFATFGLTQSVVAVLRRRTIRRTKLTVVRVVGGIGMLPLFGAAGSIMLPTVVGGGLAYARADWRKRTRAICVAVAAAPVLFVGNQLVDNFGWSFHALFGFAAMLAIYATIIWATQFTFGPQADGWHLNRWAKITISAAGGLLFLSAFVIGGGIK
jgi:hypothetical protein